MKKTSIALLAVLVAAIAYGYDIRHPNLKDASQAAGVAIHHIELAQSANKGVEFGGHAAKAIGLLQQAQQEMIAADQYINAHEKK
jgi:hypothetical protein